MPLPADFRPAHMLNTFVCSGHGKWDPSFGRFVTPANVTLIFWVYHGEALINGTTIEDLVFEVKEEKVTRPGKSYNMHPRKLATDAKLAGFESHAVNREMDLPPRPRFGLPEVISAYTECYNYELSYDAEMALYLTMVKSRLSRDWEGYPVDNVIHCSRDLRTRMLADIVDELVVNPAEEIHVHWAACRAIQRLIP